MLDVGCWMLNVERVLWKRHHPIFRFLLLGANCLLPPIFLACFAFGAMSAFVVAISAAMLSHALLFVAIFHPRCPWLGPVVRGFRTARRAVWLTIDDGPDCDWSIQLSEQLRVRGVCATFFVIGERARREPEILRALLANGHTLANHSATHPRGSTWCLGPQRAEREVSEGAGAIATHNGETRWFRAPVGHKSPFLHPALRKNGARLIAWTCGGRDGWTLDSTRLVNRILAAARPGAILLLHEGRRHSVENILAVVDALRARGYEFTIPEDLDLEE
jgi:peptidoglycan/xylan/chitin deacetylase (PgdA/CDA1 family)